MECMQPTSFDARYPIGRFQWSGSLTEAGREQAIQDLAALPKQIRAALAVLTPEQFDTPYRPGGWTVRQVVHHIADSHLNSYVRVRLALTEENPTIKPYDEARWADLEDAKTGPLEPSLQLLESLHERFVALWRSLPPEAFDRTFLHPDNGPQTLARTLALYAWHGRHHLGHLRAVQNAS